jgi:hypothetical protein
MSNIGTLTIEMAANIARLQSDMHQAKSVVSESMKSITDAVDLAKKAFVAFAGVATAAAFADMIKSNIKAADELGKLAEQAGVTTEAMSKLAGVGKLSGTAADTVAAAMNKMTKAMSGTTEDAKGAAAALRAMGMNFADFQQLSPDERMLATAKAMDEFRDGAGKSAVAMALMGKSGAEMLPYMKDLATVGELHAKVTGEQAAMAKDFDQNLKRVTATSESWKKELSMGMLPALDDASQAFLGVMNSTGGLREEIIKLSKDGTIEGYVRGAITVLTYFADAAEYALRAIKIMGEGIGAYIAGLVTVFGGLGEAIKLALTGHFAEAGAALSSTFTQSKAIVTAYGASISDTFGADTMGAKFRARMEEVKGLSAATAKAKADADAAKPKIDDNFNQKSAGDAAGKDKELAAYQALVKAIGEKTAVAQLELDGTIKLTEGEKDAAKFTSTLANGTVVLTQAHAANVTKMLETQIAQEKVNVERAKEIAATAAAADAHWKYLESLDAGIKKTQDEIAAQDEQTARLGLSKEAVAALDAAKLNLLATETERKAIRELDKNLDEAEYAMLMKQAQAYRDLGKSKIIGAETQAAADAFKALWDSVDRTAHDTFVNIFQGGQDAFTKLRDTLKSTLLDLLYQMTVRKWVFDITASVSGATGGAVSAAAQGLSGAGAVANGVSAAGTIGGAASAFTGAFSTGAAIGTEAFGAGVTMMSEATGMSSFLAGAGQALGAVGPVGWAAMAALAVLALNGSPKITATGGGITATLNSTGTTTGMVGQYNSFTEEGRGGTTQNRDWSTANQSTTDYIVNSVSANTAAATAYAASIGLSTAALTGYTKSIDINTTGMDAAAAKAAIDAELTKYLNEQISNAYGTALSSMAVAGETSSQTLQRVSTELFTVNGIFGAMGTTLFSISISGAQAADGLVKAMGGLQNFQSQMSSYFTNFYSADEQRTAKIASITKTLNDAGLVVSTADIGGATRQQFRDAVGTIDTSTADGQKKYAAMMSVSSDFASLTTPVQQLAQVAPVAAVAIQNVSSAISGSNSSLVSALQGLTDSIFTEVNRIRGVIAGDGLVGFAQAQTQFAIATAQARAGDQSAAAALPQLSQTLLTLAAANTSTLVELKILQAQTAGSLQTTGMQLAGQYGLSVPSFDVGTNLVPQDMLAMVHKGEAIVPTAYNPANGGSSSSAWLQDLVTSMAQELAAVHAELIQIKFYSKRTADVTEKSDAIGPAPARSYL